MCITSNFINHVNVTGVHNALRRIKQNLRQKDFNCIQQKYEAVLKVLVSIFVITSLTRNPLKINTHFSVEPAPNAGRQAFHTTSRFLIV
jgi:fucose permease